MPLIETRGAGSAQGFGEFAQSAAVNYIEDVFSTYLYTGNSSTQTITNGIDLSGKGGLVWMKGRSGATDHALYDTARGATKDLVSNSTAAETTESTGLTAFSGTGFSIGALAKLNTNAATYASWTFRKQKKFFDVVTYTGDGNTSKTIPHNLGSVPGCIITKMTSGVNNWQTYHRSLGNTQAVQLNLTNAASTNTGFWNNTSPTATDFTVGTVENASGETYVAYLFAHDAGGFGLSGSDNVISCGSYTGNGSSTGPTITLGYEPQWVMVKRTTVSTGSWEMYDSMRGFTMGADAVLRADTSGAEFSLQRINPTSTGFQLADSDGDVNANGSTYIYIAIRRGPMKVPTSGTSVYNAIARNGTGAVANVTGVGFAPDLSLSSERGTVFVGDKLFFDKLRGANARLTSTATSAESSSATDMLTAFGMDGVTLGADANWYINKNANPYINWYFRRAPGFFDVVCYTGNDVARTVSHNLGAVPELIIVKARNNGTGWCCYAASLGNTTRIYLNQTGSATSGVSSWNSTTPTSSVFSLLGPGDVNQSGYNYVAYLFATVAGISKVGSYTGTGTTLQIDCGFTGGARFVLIKRTDSTGDWYVWDSARGIVASTDPYLLLNSTAAEVTNTDYVDTYSAGFELSSTAPAALNANGGSFIFFAVA